MSHTPGPWRQRTGRDGSPTLRVEDGQGLSVAIVKPWPTIGEENANARLIAAAPDLLAALEKIAETCDDKGARLTARAAIAKVRGGSR